MRDNTGRRNTGIIWQYRLGKYDNIWRYKKMGHAVACGREGLKEKRIVFSINLLHLYCSLKTPHKTFTDTPLNRDNSEWGIM